MKLTEEEKKELKQLYGKRYRAENREKILAYHRDWREKRRESEAARSRQYNAEHVEERKAYRKNRRKEINEYQKRYFQTPNGIVVLARRHAKRRMALAATQCTLTADEWQSILEMNKHRCYWCKKKRKLTMDHVIPLNPREGSGRTPGRHVKENIVPACRRCNSSKSNKIVMLL